MLLVFVVFAGPAGPPGKRGNRGVKGDSGDSGLTVRKKKKENHKFIGIITLLKWKSCVSVCACIKLCRRRRHRRCI